MVDSDKRNKHDFVTLEFKEIENQIDNICKNHQFLKNGACDALLALFFAYEHLMDPMEQRKAHWLPEFRIPHLNDGLNYAVKWVSEKSPKNKKINLVISSKSYRRIIKEAENFLDLAGNYRKFEDFTKQYYDGNYSTEVNSKEVKFDFKKPSLYARERHFRNIDDRKAHQLLLDNLEIIYNHFYIFYSAKAPTKKEIHNFLADRITPIAHLHIQQLVDSYFHDKRFFQKSYKGLTLNILIKIWSYLYAQSSILIAENIICEGFGYQKEPSVIIINSEELSKLIQDDGINSKDIDNFLEIFTHNPSREKEDVQITYLFKLDSEICIIPYLIVTNNLVRNFRHLITQYDNEFYASRDGWADLFSEQLVNSITNLFESKVFITISNRRYCIDDHNNHKKILGDIDVASWNSTTIFFIECKALKEPDSEQEISYADDQLTKAQKQLQLLEWNSENRPDIIQGAIPELEFNLTTLQKIFLVVTDAYLGTEFVKGKYLMLNQTILTRIFEQNKNQVDIIKILSNYPQLPYAEETVGYSSISIENFKISFPLTRIKDKTEFSVIG